MSEQTPPEPIAPLIVSAEAVASKDPYDVILSNIEVVNELAALLGPDELPAAALISYYTDFYQAQMANGGFSQFAFNSEASPLVLECVAAGLEQMGATRHAAVFSRARAELDAMSTEDIEDYLESDLFGENPVRDRLDAAAAGFAEAEDDLVIRNAAYLMSQPDVVVLPEEEIQGLIRDLIAELPDLAEREAALEDMPQPDFVYIVIGLCERAGLVLDRITAGSPGEGGEIDWFFLTDKGLHRYETVGDEAVLYPGEGDEEILRARIADLLPVG